MTALTPVESLAQLDDVRRLVAEHFDPDEPLTRAALHLLDCAAGVLHRLPGDDLDSAVQALASARAAVVAASYAVRRVHDLARTEQA
jgi:uncharacterized protein HemX